MKRNLSLAQTAILTITLFAATQQAYAFGGETTKRLDPKLDYRAERSDPITHQVDFSAVVTPPYHCEKLKVWFPIPQSDAGQEISESDFTTFPMEVKPRIATEEVYGNKFAYFEFDHPEGAQIIRHRFTAKVWDLYWRLDPDKVASVESWPKEFGPYLRPEAVAARESFRSVLKEIVPRRSTAAGDLFRVMDWIDSNLTYDHVKASLQADPEHAFTLRRGHCSDYHGLCAEMGRALGYPARVTYGLQLFPKNSPSHCRVEIFLPPYGWVSFDVSETQKLAASIVKNKNLSTVEQHRLIEAARRRLREGFRENSWLLATKGTNYELAPKAAKPVHVVRTIYAEADGEALPDPDPANGEKREFGWMTVHKYTADKPFKQPFKDLSTLEMEDAEN